jgi:hypothetical protein
MLGGSLVFDADSLAGAKAEAGARSERDEPKLCPDPSPDVPHGASERAKAYQEQISRLNNPQRPLPAGMAVSLENPLTGKNVAFDDCRDSDGTLIARFRVRERRRHAKHEDHGGRGSTALLPRAPSDLAIACQL